MNRLASLAACLLLIGCGALPKGLGPKPDVKPIQTTVEQTQASVGRARESITKLRESQKAAGVASGRVSEALRRAPTSEAVEAAKSALADADRQRAVSDQYIEWADTELANSWRFLDDAKKQITVLGTEVDRHYENEKLAIAAVAKYKPVYDACNKILGPRGLCLWI